MILLIPYQHSVSLLPFPIHCGMVRLVNFVLWLSRTKSYMQRRAHIATDLPAASCVARPLRNRKRFYSCGRDTALYFDARNVEVFPPSTRPRENDIPSTLCSKIVDYPAGFTGRQKQSRRQGKTFKKSNEVAVLPRFVHKLIC